MNNLPPLPQQNKKKEATFGVWLKGYTEDNPPIVTTGLELKQTNKNSIPFSVVKPKQIASGVKAKSGKGVWIRVQGGKGEQDYIYVVNAQSYIVIKFPKVKCWIDIEEFIKERDTSKRKSLTVERAVMIADHVI